MINVTAENTLKER